MVSSLNDRRQYADNPHIYRSCAPQAKRAYQAQIKLVEHRVG
jgi:hypothetical protein